MIMTEMTFLETISNGHSIVFFYDSYALHTAAGVAMKHSIPTVTFMSKESLRQWQRVHTTKPNGILLVHIANCTGWHTYADRVIWLKGLHYDQFEQYDQTSHRIRGKTVQPIIFLTEDIK